MTSTFTLLYAVIKFNKKSMKLMQIDMMAAASMTYLNTFQQHRWVHPYFLLHIFGIIVRHCSAKDSAGGNFLTA